MNLGATRGLSLHRTSQFQQEGGMGGAAFLFQRFCPDMKVKYAATSYWTFLEA